MAHSVAQVQLAPTGLKSISSSHYLKREKERKERERAEGGKKEGKNWRGETSTLLSLQPQTPPLHTVERKDELGGGKKNLRKRETLHVACLNLDKAPPVNLLEVWNALLSPMLLLTCVSGDDTVCPETSSKNVPLQHPLCKIGVKYSQ